MTEQLDRTSGLLARIRLRERGADCWRGRTGNGASEQTSRGLLAAQSTVAAGLSVDARRYWVHSVHLTYLEQGDPSQDVDYQVERLYDSEHTTTRLVRAVQGSGTLATAVIGFQAARRGTGPTHQDGGPGQLPDPHSLPSLALDADPASPIDIRYLDRAPWQPPAGPESANRMWVRVTEELPDEIVLHAAALLFAADLLLVAPVVPPRPGEWTDLETGRALQAVSLDLSMSFHRGFRADDWVLHEHRSPSRSDYRGYSTGRFFSSMGRLIASVSQETALLPVTAPAHCAEAVGTRSVADQ